jgi:hypothetical protein
LLRLIDCFLTWEAGRYGPASFFLGESDRYQAADANGITTKFVSGHLAALLYYWGKWLIADS